MIQRIQSVYLAIAAILALVVVFMRLQVIDTLQMASAVLSIVTIMKFKKRRRQTIFCLYNLLLIFAWYICVAAFEGKVTVIESLPMVEAILVFLARKGIMDDEKLVRSADRIR